MENNFLTEFNTGGTHEQNPLGGIPQGMGANGKPNTVEEGETKSKDYVFSDRIILDEKLIKKYALPKNLKGKTMAEASKKLNDSFKETSSKIDRETTDEMIGRLTEASEEARITEELANMPDENKKQLGGMLNHQNQMFLGGFNESQFGAGLQEGAIGKEVMGSVGTGLGAISTGLELGNMAFGKTGIDTSGRSEAPDVKVGANIGSGALKGASAGMAFGPWGAAIGGVVGGAAGLIGGSKAKKEAMKAETNFDLGQNAQYRNTFAMGGYTGPGDDVIHLPRKEGEEQEEALMHYQNQKKLTDSQVDGFLAQRESDRAWAQNRDKYIEDSFKTWRSGKTGNSPNNKFTQISPEYQSAMQNIKNTWHKENPRQVNEIVSEYANNFNDGGPINYQPNGYGALQLANTVTPYGLTSMFSGKDRYNTENPLFGRLNAAEDLQNMNKNVVDVNRNTFAEQPEKESFLNNTLNKTGNFLKENHGEIMRYAPVAANALQLANLKKPEQESLDRLDSRYKPDYVDERQLVNRASSEYNNVANSLKSATNGSVGALRSNLLAAHMNRTKGLSDSFLQADNINRGENRFGQQFNNQNDRVNLNQSNQEKDINARNRASYDNNKSKFISQMGTDIGNIGLEQMRKKYPERMGLYYNHKGKFIG